VLKNNFELVGTVGKKIDSQSFETGAVKSTLHIYRSVGENKFDTFYIHFWDREDTCFSLFIFNLKEGDKVHVSGNIRGSYYKKNDNDIYKLELLGREISKVEWDSELGPNGDYRLIKGQSISVYQV